MATPDPPQLQDHRPRILGLLPQNMQTRVLAGVALLMSLIILFSGRKPLHEKTVTPTPATQATDLNQSRIQEYRDGIEAATRQLASEEAALAHAKQSLQQGTSSGPAFSKTPRAPSPVLPGTFESSKPDWSLFASNIALSYRTASTVNPPAAKNSRVETNGSKALNAAEDASSAITGPDGPRTYRLLEGTVIETALTNRLDSSFSGPVNCLVTTDVYSSDRTVVLIPQGSRVLGEVRKLESLGEQRLAVVFHRLIRPDGYSFSLDKFQGLNQIGETGLRDQINHHYLQIFGASLAIGAVAGLAQAHTRYGLDQSAADAYQQGVATNLSQSSMHILDRYLNVLPTFTIREGHRIKVYLSQDIELPAYTAE